MGIIGIKAVGGKGRSVMFYQPVIMGNKPYRAKLCLLGNFDSHWHSEIEIIRCLSGGFRVLLDGRAYTIKPGQTVLVGSAVLHEIKDCQPETNVQYIEFGKVLLGEAYEALSARSFETPVLMPPEAGAGAEDIVSALYTLLAHTESESLSDPAAADWLLRSYLYGLAAKLMQLPASPVVTKERAERMQAYAAMHTAMDYIAAHYMNDISIEEIAGITGYGKSLFCKKFKCATQTSFHKYLNLCRIDKACALLADDRLPVARIGEQVGFRDTKTFCRVFKQIMNQTPTAYRASL